MKNRNKLSRSLVKNYIFFSITVGVLVIAFSLLFNFRLIYMLGTDSLSEIQASDIVRPNIVDIPTANIELLEGWVEILDEDLQIIDVKGNKVDSPTVTYTERQLNQLFYDQDDNPYHISLAPFVTNEGQTLYCLIKIPKENLRHSFAITSKAKETTHIFWGVLIETVITFSLLFIVSVYIYSRWTASRITNPLHQIVEGIKHVASGHYSKRIDFKGSYELKQIQEHFNVMADKLEKTEREKRELAESKQRMLVDISHDLKTPITTIQGYVEALQRGLIQDEEKKQNTLNLIHNKARLVTSLIEDVFDLSKLESPDYPFTTEVQDITEFMRELSAHFYMSFEDKQFNFHYEIPASELLVSFNNKLLFRSLSNLLSNALNHNQSGTEVQLKLMEGADHVYIHIADDGIGISEDNRIKVFEAFYRGDQSRKSDGGTGLGLTISKTIIDLHKGLIHLDSSQRNTLFRITLPK
ncbi:HAMP domain-containing protein [Paenibacillus sp. GSMTC-2017]|uniref:sensor histidine kinase n=1 Tax=Paenibacillus sp. GSMTC-2017 TaxID=2794350 RepID=UPI0018D81D1F|nr:sensor histidine kinase [Paenibacillus sp. GSMTC-2017]MBH5316817.1 HAMP domain-containing protein [Paenibacillus sp. GSMTC-2017]